MYLVYVYAHIVVSICTYCTYLHVFKPISRSTKVCVALICANTGDTMDLIQANRPAWLGLRKRNFKLSGTQVCPSVLLFKTVLKTIYNILSFPHKV